MIYETDRAGNKIGVLVENYNKEGIRDVQWLGTNVVKYHRTISTLLNTLIQEGFVIEEILEPVPSEASLKLDVDLSRYYNIPDFLFIKAKKRGE